MLRGFEFLLSSGGWVRIQGSGGMIGDSSLAALNCGPAQCLEALCDALLHRVQAQVRREGIVRIAEPNREGFTIHEVTADVLACRPLDSEGRGVSGSDPQGRVEQNRFPRGSSSP